MDALGLEVASRVGLRLNCSILRGRPVVIASRPAIGAPAMEDADPTSAGSLRFGHFVAATDRRPRLWVIG